MDRLIVIHISGLVETFELPPDEDFDLDWVRGKMKHDCHLEHLSIKYEGKPAHLFCDEDGLLVGLHSNPCATSIVAGFNKMVSPRFVGPVAIWTGSM